MPANSSAEPPSEQEERRSLYNRLTAFETLLIFGGVALFVVLLLEMQAFLNPPLIGAAGAILLWPLRQHRTVRALLISGAFLVGLWFLDALSAVLTPFVIVYLLAFLFDPLVTYLKHRYKVARWVSSLGVTVVSLGAIALILLLLVPNILGQLRILSTRLLSGIEFFREWVATTTTLDALEQYDLVDRSELNDQLTTIIQSQLGAFTDSLPEVVQQFLQSLGSVLGTLTIVSMMPVLLFYTLKDYPHIKRSLVELFPTFGGERDYLVKAGTVVGGYLRGLLIVMAIAAFNVSVAFVLLDVPFGLLLGILAGLLNLIPNLGALITFILAILVAFIFGDPWFIDAIKVTAVLLGQGFLEQTVLTPNILSYHVGLHPVLILLALFVFGSFMGTFGLLIAVPATALIMTIYKAYRDEWTLDISDYTSTPSASQIRHWPLTGESTSGAAEDSDETTPDRRPLDP